MMSEFCAGEVPASGLYDTADRNLGKSQFTAVASRRECGNLSRGMVGHFDRNILVRRVCRDDARAGEVGDGSCSPAEMVEKSTVKFRFQIS